MANLYAHRKAIVLLTGALLTASLPSCSSSPPPTVAELTDLADRVTSSCRHTQNTTCTDLKKQFCDGIGAYIDSQGDEVPLEDTFGSNWYSVKKAAGGCSNIRISY